MMAFNVTRLAPTLDRPCAISVRAGALRAGSCLDTPSRVPPEERIRRTSRRAGEAEFGCLSETSAAFLRPHRLPPRAGIERCPKHQVAVPRLAKMGSVCRGREVQLRR